MIENMRLGVIRALCALSFFRHAAQSLEQVTPSRTELLVTGHIGEKMSEFEDFSNQQSA